MKKKIVSILLLAVAVVGIFVLKNNKSSSTTVAVDSVVAVVTNETQHKQMPLPRLLDLGSVTCVPCKMMSPILEEMEKTFAGQFDVEFIDVWEKKAEGDKYGIRMIPTQIFFNQDGKELFRHEGFFSREDILLKWNELGFTMKDQVSDK